MPIVPRDVRKALDLLRADPSQNLRIDELAAACGVARRTLQKHFRRFSGQTPSQARRKARLEWARREMLRARRGDNVTRIANRCGFGHLGRFSAAYRERYGESPSATLRHQRQALSCSNSSRTILSPRLDRPVIAVHSFDVTGEWGSDCPAVADEITIALSRHQWLAIGRPETARYQLHGTCHRNATQRHRILAVLSDAATNRHIWADRWLGDFDELFYFVEQAASRVATAVERAIRNVEIDRASHEDPSLLGAWELTMKALPSALLIDPKAQADSLDLLERAMDLAPQDALPVALAAWCHAQRGIHHFTSQSAAERQAGHDLALRASRLNTGDPRVEALLAAAETLTHNIPAASWHCDRALSLDGGCAWGWMRKGFVHAYLGQSADAIECFQIAKGLEPDDPLNFTYSVGMGIACYEVGQFDKAAGWWTRLLLEHPPAIWANRFRAPAFAFAGQREEANLSFAELRGVYPDLTISDVRSALPHTQSYLDRTCEGLESLGMRL